MTTQYLAVSSSALLGYKQYYRLTFDVTRQVLFESSSDKLNYIYDHMAETGVIEPLSPNPVTDGTEVMVVDCWTPTSDAASISVAEGVRRLELVAGGSYESVRSIQLLSGIGDVTGGANARQTVTDTTVTQNAATDPLSKLTGFLAGVGDYVTLGVIALVAYAVITLSAGLPLLGSRRK